MILIRDGHTDIQIMRIFANMQMKSTLSTDEYLPFFSSSFIGPKMDQPGPVFNSCPKYHYCLFLLVLYILRKQIRVQNHNIFSKKRKFLVKFSIFLVKISIFSVKISIFSVKISIFSVKISIFFTI